MENEIRELYRTYKIRKISLESTDIAVVRYMVNRNNWTVIIYGGGNFGIFAVKFTRDVLGLEPKYILDKDPKIKEVEGVPVLNRKEFMGLKSSEFCAFVATLAFSNEKENTDINNYLEEAGCSLVCDIVRAMSNIVKPDFYACFVKRKEEFIKRYDLFEDDISKKVYCSYIKALLEGKDYCGPVLDEEDKYFGSGKNIPLYKPCNEVWVNIGSSRGDTIFHFLNKDMCFERLYAIEGNCQKFEILRKNISFLPEEIKNRIILSRRFCGIGNGEIVLDDLTKSEKVTLINMDIEGDELNAINSAEAVITRDHPVLAICAYHKPDDLLVLPDRIKELYPGYHFVLRKYLSGAGAYYNAIYRINELVLYAIPEERMI